MRDGHETGLSRVPEMMVAARDPDELPTTGLDQFDDRGAVPIALPS
jgi:hypothetical protein